MIEEILAKLTGTDREKSTPVCLLKEDQPLQLINARRMKALKEKRTMREEFEERQKKLHKAAWKETEDYLQEKYHVSRSADIRIKDGVVCLIESE